MKTTFLLGFLFLVCIPSCFAKDLIVGTSYNARLIWQQKAEYNAIPLRKRVKEVFYAEPGNQLLKGIIARDLDHTDATAIITAGGVGSSYANIRLKSDRGRGLNYQIEVRGLFEQFITRAPGSHCVLKKIGESGPTIEKYYAYHPFMFNNTIVVTSSFWRISIKDTVSIEEGINNEKNS